MIVKNRNVKSLSHRRKTKISQKSTAIIYPLCEKWGWSTVCSADVEHWMSYLSCEFDVQESVIYLVLLENRHWHTAFHLLWWWKWRNWKKGITVNLLQLLNSEYFWDSFKDRITCLPSSILWFICSLELVGVFSSPKKKQSQYYLQTLLFTYHHHHIQLNHVTGNNALALQ